MELNETLVKVDQTLDNTTKKIERLATEMVKDELFVEVGINKKSKQKVKDVNKILVSPLQYL